MPSSSPKTSSPSSSPPLFTLDLLFSVLSRTLFSPAFSLFLPLCLRALATPYSAPSFILSSIFSFCVLSFQILSFLNKKATYGAPRPMQWEDEVVVITGGAGGLGACLAECWGMRGVGVGVVDVRVPKSAHGEGQEAGEGEGGVRHYKCDVSDPEQLKRTWERFTRDLGTPTILVNNAGIVRFGSVVDTPVEDVEKVLRTNALAHFMGVKLLLEGLEREGGKLRSRGKGRGRGRKGGVKGGTIVTVSSVLGQLTPSHLSAYNASKAAVTAFHHTLTTELRYSHPNVRTVLVSPGQLDSQLFSKARVTGRLQGFLAPVVPVSRLAMRIVEMVDSGMGGEVRMPAYASGVEVFGLLPRAMQRAVRWWSGIDEALGQEREESNTQEDPKAAGKDLVEGDEEDELESSSLDDSDES